MKSTYTECGSIAVSDMEKGGASTVMIDAPPCDKGYFPLATLFTLQREVGLVAR